VGVKDVINAIMVGSVTNMLRNSILTVTHPTQVMAKNAQNVRDLEN
tara:strand:- start:10181 stop:10318 length:138 start_codon:yes stop_codon:yes gene_type:complete